MPTVISPEFYSVITLPWVLTWGFRVVAALVVLSFGNWIAQRLTSALRRMMHRVSEQEAVANSPLGVVAHSVSAVQGSGLVTNTLYWGIFLFFALLAGELVGFPFFHGVWSGLVLWLPSVISALIVFFVGIVLAGVLEQAVKQPLKRMAPQQAVLAGTFTSYGVVALFTLIAVSELGIASQFILVLFAGVVFALALAFGLALGLGAQDMVYEMLQKMVQDETKSRVKKHQ